MEIRRWEQASEGRAKVGLDQPSLLIVARKSVTLLRRRAAYGAWQRAAAAPLGSVSGRDDDDERCMLASLLRAPRRCQLRLAHARRRRTLFSRRCVLGLFVF
jgi:hypothetical protein